MIPRQRVDISEYTVQLEVFEGPLDLLLHLIRQQEIDIYDIPIATITDQYLRHVRLMKELNISIAGEFLVMAATLIYIKSQMLLPAPDSIGEEGVEGDPRRELVERLLEHERFQKAAHMLYERETLELSIWPRGQNEFEAEEQKVVSATLFDLVQAFQQAVERYKEQIVLEIEHDPVSIEEKIEEIRRLLSVERELLFSFFFRHRLTRLHLVVTLFALLELARLREITLRQKKAFDDIRICAC